MRPHQPMRRAGMLAVSALWALPAWADGMLDPDFGRDGRVTTDFGRSAWDWAHAVVVLPDGRAVAAGDSAVPDLPGTMAVSRYLPSGDLDASFDGDGLKRLEFTADRFGPVSAGAREVFALPDGKLVLAGWWDTLGGPPDGYALARLNADGSLDSSFGDEGLVVTPLAGAVAAGHAAVLQPDGRIVVLGVTGAQSASTVALVRYNADGSLDGSFGTAGQVALPQAVSFHGTALGLQADGKILIGGTVGPIGGPSDFGLMRLLPSGALDASFGSGGFVTSDFGGREEAHSLAVQADGRILISGWLSAPPASGLALVRYLPNGALDTSFGAKGLASNDSGLFQVADALVVLPNAKVLVAGFSEGRFLLARFNGDGSLDMSFGTEGVLLTSFADLDWAQALAISGPDRVLAVGLTYAIGEGGLAVMDFALARYIATTPVELTSFSVE